MSNNIEITAAAQQKNIEKATKAKNPINKVEFNDIIITSRTKSDMDPKMLKWAFKLAERNVSPFYKELSMGWQPKVKQNDINKNWARFLVAMHKGTPIAYTMFRFDLDYGYSVLYCYEMQIEPSQQRKGLGKFMMTTLEECARQWHMEKVVLTVLKNNANAICFFKAIGYSLDDSSPDILDNAEYEILSKQIN